MNVKIKATKRFKRQFKKLHKKYFSPLEDLEKLTNEIKSKPDLGTHLGKNLYKNKISNPK